MLATKPITALDVPDYNPMMPRDETHPVCIIQGHINSFNADANVSGHDFIQIGGDNPLNAILQCSVCDTISK